MEREGVGGKVTVITFVVVIITITIVIYIHVCIYVYIYIYIQLSLSGSIPGTPSSSSRVGDVLCMALICIVWLYFTLLTLV